MYHPAYTFFPEELRNPNHFTEKEEERNKRFNLIIERINNSDSGRQLMIEQKRNFLIDQGSNKRWRDMHDREINPINRKFMVKLMYSLLNDNHTFTQFFWRCYAESFQLANQFYSSFTLKDIQIIFESLDSNTNNSDDALEAKRNFKEFIDANGVIRKASLTHIDHIGNTIGNNVGAIQVLSMDKKTLDKITYDGKTLITQALLSLHGIKSICKSGSTHLNSSSPTKNEMNFLSKQGLIKAPPKRVQKLYKKYIDEITNYDYESLEKKISSPATQSEIDAYNLTQTFWNNKGISISAREADKLQVNEFDLLGDEVKKKILRQCGIDEDRDLEEVWAKGGAWLHITSNTPVALHTHREHQDIDMRLKAMIEVLESNNKNPHEHENSGNFVKLFKTFYVANQKEGEPLNWPPEIEREIENEWNEMTKAALEAAIKDEIDPDDFDMESKRRSAKINYDYKSWALSIIEALKTLRIALNARRQLFTYSGSTIDHISLSLLAGFKNEKTLQNVIYKKDSPLKNSQYCKFSQRYEIFGFEAIKWLGDNERKYPIYFPLNTMPPKQTIEYDLIQKNLMKSNQVTIIINGVAQELNDTDVFVRTDNLPRSNAAKHNVARWNWIGKEGRTFAEINQGDSFYRQNVVRQTYKGNKTSIIKDLEYDLKNGWIEKKD
tara:strand:- start:31 stop:2025 length:1995 start_codon:yes stop_codon:yes gene_type:complete